MAYILVPHRVEDTVVAQLRDLFATPRGSVALYPDYGFDFSIIDTSMGQSIDLQEMGFEIKEMIRKYVPRVDVEKAEIKLYYDPTKAQLYLTVDSILINLTERPNSEGIQAND